MSNPETVHELLTQWDTGDSIWSIEMGGIGPGYEQAIQVLAVEIMRDHHHLPLPTGEAQRTWADATIARIDEHIGGFSGAQVEAAKHIAYKFMKEGPSKAMETCPEDRKILVSNFFPTVQP